MTKMAATSIYMVKNPSKIFFSRTCRTDFHETWYVASRTPAHHSCSNDDPRMTLTYFTARSNFETVFSMGKSENSGFFRNIQACDMKVGRCRELIDFMKACEY